MVSRPQDASGMRAREIALPMTGPVSARPEATVLVVDDDASMRDAIGSLVRSVGLRLETFATARDFMRRKKTEGPACMVLDVRLPGLSGLELQRELAAANQTTPIIFITGYGDIPMSVTAMKAGAVEFLPKPFRAQDLLDAIQQAIAQDTAAFLRRAEIAALRARYENLTPREREVMALAAAGLLNKHIADHLGTSEITVKLQRSEVMRKLAAATVVDLARMAEKLGLAV